MDLPDGERASLHATDTLDFVVVVQGEIELGTGDGASVRLGRGDTVVQRGARHRWRVVGDGPCTYAVVMLRPDPAAGPAAPMTSRDGAGGRPRVVDVGGRACTSARRRWCSTSRDPAVGPLAHGRSAQRRRPGRRPGRTMGARAATRRRIVPHGRARSRAPRGRGVAPHGQRRRRRRPLGPHRPRPRRRRVGRARSGRQRVVQRGAHHRWRVLGDEPVHLAVTMLAPGASRAVVGSGDGARGGDGVLLAAIGRRRASRSVCTCRRPAGGRCASRWHGSARDGRSCSAPTRSRPTSTRRRRTPPRRGAAGRSRSRSTSTRRGGRATTRSSWRSTSARRCGATTRSSSCARRPARASCSRWRPTRGTPTTTSADRTCTPAAPTSPCSGRWRRATCTSRRARAAA